jgi:hypothetical protein
MSESYENDAQGLNWYARSMKRDSDGDVADEFLEEAAGRPLQVWALCVMQYHVFVCRCGRYV